MKVKKSQLNELIRLITRQILKEYTSMSSTGIGDDSSSSSDKPEDAMTSAEKARLNRRSKIQTRRELDLAKKEKDTEKEKAEAFKSQYDQWRLYGKGDAEKHVKDLTAKVTSGP
jgi:hypothetical protein